MLRRVFSGRSNSLTTPPGSPTKSPSRTPAEKKTEQQRRKVALVKSILVKYVIPVGIVSLILFVIPIVYFAITRLGFGSKFPKQSFFADMKPVMSSKDLEVVAELPIPPGNIAVSSKNRIFFNFHPEYSPAIIKVAELTSKTTYAPFPSLAFQSKFVTVLSMRIDRQDRLWLLDYGKHGMTSSPKLFAFDLRKKDELVKEYSFPSAVAGFGSMLNDFQVDPTGYYVYIADTSIIAMTPGIIVYAVYEDKSYRVISSHASLFGPSLFLDISGSVISYGPLGMKVHVDSIALDRTGSRLYFGAMSGDKLYSVLTSHLLHYVKAINASSSSKQQLDRNMHSYITLVTSEKPVTDGISTDGSGNIWMTCVEHSAIALAVPLKVRSKTVPVFANQEQVFKIVKVLQDPALLRWPDGLSFGNDGLYISNSALQLRFKGITDYSTHAPFHILKLSSRKIHSDLVLKDGSIVMPAAGH